MGTISDKAAPEVETKTGSKCLSCGKTEGMGNRRYCSIECRQKLRHQLNVRTGLLKALNTQYATFFFTDDVLVMDVLPYNSVKLYSFIFPRNKGKKPVQDFAMMSNVLGNAWWAEMSRTNRKYLASRHVLGKAVRNSGAIGSIKPEEIKIPTMKGKGRYLLHLKLDKNTLNSPELIKILKSAFRRQAIKSHPDVGGTEAAFRRIHRAYRELVKWAEKPSFLKRSGFPDKWFYDGRKNRWIQPTPAVGVKL